MAQGSDDISSPSLHFHEKCYTEVPKIESTLKVKEVVDYLKQKLSSKELLWFTEHPQFRHIFHMHHEDNSIHMGWWLLLVRTADTARKDECWFVVNGVPIRYSLREHALITGLSCHSLQPGYEHVSCPAFIERCMGSQEVNILDVHKRLDDMEQCDTNDDRLKMAVLYFLGSVLTGTKNKNTNLEKFLVNVVDDLALCRSFAWGSYTFFQCLENINKIIKDSKGIVKKRVVFPGFILGFERLAFESISNLKNSFLRDVVTPDGACPRMCTANFDKTNTDLKGLKGFPLEMIYTSLGNTKEIQSILVCKPGEEHLLENIEQETNVDVRTTFWKDKLSEGKSIWWEDLYHKDLYHRKIKQALKSSLPQAGEGAQADEGALAEAGAQVLRRRRAQGAEDELKKKMEKIVQKELKKKTKFMNKQIISLKKDLESLKRKSWKLEQELSNSSSSRDGGDQSHGGDQSPQTVVSSGAAIHCTVMEDRMDDPMDDEPFKCNQSPQTVVSSGAAIHCTVMDDRMDDPRDDEPFKCNLINHNGNNDVVAIGWCYPSLVYLHIVPLKPDEVVVTVSEVKIDIPLWAPVDDIEMLKNAFDTFIVWPKKMVVHYEEENGRELTGTEEEEERVQTGSGGNGSSPPHSPPPPPRRCSKRFPKSIKRFSPSGKPKRVPGRGRGRPKKGEKKKNQGEGEGEGEGDGQGVKGGRGRPKGSKNKKKKRLQE